MEREYRPPASEGELDPTVALLEAGVESVLNETDFPEYLKTVSKLHNYSYGNISLIYMQKPDAQMVAGYRKWQQMGRQVRRGEKGLIIITPRLRTERDLETGEKIETLVGFGTGRVFDIQQTDGDEITPLALADAGENVETASLICDRVTDFFQRDGVSLVPDGLGMRPTQRGGYHPFFRQVSYRPGMPAADTANTLIHEAAHHIVFTRPWGQEPKRRNDHEIVAQGASFVVNHRYGLDVSEYSFHYLKEWADGNLELVKNNLHAIQKTAHTLIDELERPREKWLVDRGITQPETPPQSPETGV